MLLRGQTARVIVVADLLLAAVACSSPKIIAGPTPIPTPPPRVFSQFQGRVHDTAFRPLLGVAVEIVSEAPSQAPITGTTNADGYFSVTGTFSGVVTIRAVAEGYLTGSQSLNLQGLCSNCHAYVDLPLETVGPPVALETGDYTLTVSADPACAEWPDDLRIRTYAARVTPYVTPFAPPNTQYTVTVSGFAALWDRFGLYVAGNYVGANDYDTSQVVSEFIPPNRYLDLNVLDMVPNTDGTHVDSSPVSSLSLTAVWEYCALKSGVAGNACGTAYTVGGNVLARAFCRGVVTLTHQ